MVDFVFGADYTTQLNFIVFGVWLIAATSVVRLLNDLGIIRALAE